MAKKVMIPLELKLDFYERAYASFFKGVMYAIRETYGTNAVLEIIEKIWNMDDRVKNMTTTLLKIFKIEGNDAEKIGRLYDVYHELTGFEHTWLELSKTTARYKVTKCPFKPAYKDLSDLCLIFGNIITKTINPEATVERPKGMCAGDPYCEFVHKIDNKTSTE